MHVAFNLLTIRGNTGARKRHLQSHLKCEHKLLKFRVAWKVRIDLQHLDLQHLDESEVGRKERERKGITRKISGSSKEKEGVLDETGANTPSPRRSAAGVKEKSPRIRIVLFPAARRIVYKKRRSNERSGGKKTRRRILWRRDNSRRQL